MLLHRVARQCIVCDCCSGSLCRTGFNTNTVWRYKLARQCVDVIAAVVPCVGQASIQTLCVDILLQYQQLARHQQLAKQCVDLCDCCSGSLCRIGFNTNSVVGILFQQLARQCVAAIAAVVPCVGQASIQTLCVDILLQLASQCVDVIAVVASCLGSLFRTGRYKHFVWMYALASKAVFSCDCCSGFLFRTG